MQTEYEKLKDRDLPEEIKQKFYNRQLSFQEYLQYEDEFDDDDFDLDFDESQIDEMMEGDE